MSKTCYWPDGSTAADQTVCSSGTQSACCPSGSACTSNGLCYNLGYLQRGSCTDKTWGSSACPKYCYLADDSKNAGTYRSSISACQKTDIKDRQSKQYKRYPVVRQLLPPLPFHLRAAIQLWNLRLQLLKRKCLRLHRSEQTRSHIYIHRKHEHSCGHFDSNQYKKFEH